MSAFGTIIDVMPAPAAAAGRVTFDGGGGCSFSLFMYVGGIFSRDDSTFCSYTVNSDGTGQISVSFTAPLPSPDIGFVIVGSKTEIRFITQDENLIVEGVMKKQ
jgi:hypothetical protein